jgi:hypothetical protein
VGGREGRRGRGGRRRGREGRRGWGGWRRGREGEAPAAGEGLGVYIGRVRVGVWGEWVAVVDGLGGLAVEWKWWVGEGVGEVGQQESGTGGLRREPTRWLSAKGPLC